MFTIYDGRAHFYQWDTEQKLIVKDNTVLQVHFANCLCANARVCETYMSNGANVVDVPNELLTQDYDIKIWGYDGNATKHCATFEVIKRTKPEDYVYTEQELKTWEKLYRNIDTVAPTQQISNANGKIEVSDALLDFPCSIVANNFSLQTIGTGVRNTTNPLDYKALPERTTLNIDTDYRTIPAPVINFQKPFYSGEICWNDGYYTYTRTKVELNVNEIYHQMGTDYIHTKIAYQGWEDTFVASYRTYTLCNCLTYSTNKSVKDRFVVSDTGTIFIYIDALKERYEEDWQEEARKILSNAECYFIFYHLPKKVEMDEKLPQVLGAEFDDETWLTLYVADADNKTERIINSHQLNLTYKQMVKGYVDKRAAELQVYISDVEDTITELESGLPRVKTVFIDSDLCSDETYDDIRESYEHGYLVSYKYENEYGRVYITTNAILNYEDEYVHIFFPDYEYRLFIDGDVWEEV